MTQSAINTIGSRARRCLFRLTELGLEPLALWLNEYGLPRTAHGWQQTFTQANLDREVAGTAGV